MIVSKIVIYFKTQAIFVLNANLSSCIKLLHKTQKNPIYNHRRDFICY